MSEDLMRFLLQRGRPPSARDLSAFLKQNFTVDWEKEKARLESYREVNPGDYQGAAQAQQAAVRAAVAAAGPASPPLALDDGGVDDDDAFASTEVKKAPAPPPPQPGGIRPAAAVNPVKVEPRETTGQTQTQVAKSKSSSPLKWVAAGVLGVAVLGGAAAGLWFTVLQPTTSVVITINGPAEATLRFDGEVRTVQGSTTFDKVKKGPHNLIIEASGFLPATLTPVTTGEPVMTLTPVLKRVSGRLTVTSDPSGAAISLDGKATDKKTPATFELEGESTHEVRLELPDYNAVVRSDVRVPSGGEKLEKLVLKPTVVTLRIITSPEGAMVRIGGSDLGITPVAVDRAPGDPYPEVEISKPGCETMKTTVPFDREKRNDQWEGRLKCR